MSLFFQIVASSYKNTPNGIPTPIGVVIVTAAQHYRGHKASISDSTDTYKYFESAMPAELFGLRNGISLFCFDRENSIYENRLENAYSMGVIDFGHYDVNGLSDISVMSNLRGKPVTGISYALGSDDNKLDYLTGVLGGRNSEYSNGTLPLNILYSGLTDVDLISRASSLRFNYYSKLISAKPDFISGTEQQGIDQVTASINQTITDGGWYTNFMHWHWWVEDYSKNYFALLKTLIAGQDVYSGSYSDVLEYYWVREATDTITYNNGIVTINYSKKYPNSPYSNISIPLWVKVDLSGTSFAGKGITTSHIGKIRSVGNDIYYISKDLDFTLTSVNFTISETVSPNYINLNKPVVSRVGNDITSDQLVKLTLFSKLKTDTYELSAIINERKLTQVTSHTLTTTLDTTNRNYYLGFINEEGISGTLEF